MSAIASLLLIGAAAAQNAAGLPPIFRAFDSVCAGTASVEQTVARARASGWTEEAPAPGSQLALMVGMMRAAGAPRSDRTFTNEVGGRRLHLWVRETIPAPIGTFIECKVYDFAPTEPITIIANAMAWQRRAPTANIGPLRDGMHTVAWSGPNNSVIGAGIERIPCAIMRPCPLRIVVEQSVQKED